MAFFAIMDFENHERKIQRRHIRDMCNPFELPDREFLHNYRMNKDMALYLCQELQDALPHQGLPVHIRVLTSVKFMAGGSYQRGVGQDHNLCIAQRTVSKYLGQVVAAINRRLKPRWVNFPGSDLARRSVAAGFRERFGVPDVLGAIDCTHVAIFPPRRPHGLQYINRKGVHTINVQLIADVDCRILHANAQYPGRVHDQFIFNHSMVKTELRRLHNNRIGAYYLLGDSGYGLEPWLMTPILHAEPQSPEDRYTRWHCQARNVVERTNGYLKGSLRCLGLDRILHYTPEKACSLIYGCITIYNIMKHYRLEMQQVEEDQEEVQGEELADAPPALLQAAIERRNDIVFTYFT